MSTPAQESIAIINIPARLRQSDSRIKVAVLDGNVDTAHACFEGANLETLSSTALGAPLAEGTMTLHGTHVSSILFGQPDSEVEGIAPQCKGILIPVFPDRGSNLRSSVSQLDLARAIEAAVNAGAHIINLSGGQLTDDGEAEGWLENAVRYCETRNVLLIAAAGNNGCACVHAPAAMPSKAVLAVGAMDEDGSPLSFSNWGKQYQKQGILAPGEDVPGAKPGGGTANLSGTSFATPLVSGVAALMLSYQVRRGLTPDPLKIRDILLSTTQACNLVGPHGESEPSQCLVGKMDVMNAFSSLIQDIMQQDQPSAPESIAQTAATASGVTPSCSCQDGNEGMQLNPNLPGMNNFSIPTSPMNTTTDTPSPQGQLGASMAPPAESATPSGVTPSANINPGDPAKRVFVIGSVGYDFGTEARRDSFTQMMGDGKNPHNPAHLWEYLDANPFEARSLIWVLYIELTPIYAIEPGGSFSEATYKRLVDLLYKQIQTSESEDYIEKVSLPGVLSDRHVKLFSGQVVPILDLESPRGMFGWDTNTLIQDAIGTVTEAKPKKGKKQGTADAAGDGNTPNEDKLRETLRGFLNRVFYDLRNLGVTSHDRALNYAVTSAFQVASAYSDALIREMELDTVSVEKSPFCRMDSDCWDVKLKFFDPENNQRSNRVYRFTVDVSDSIPVMVGEVRAWTTSS